jgi:predicted nucleotidyltransferase
MANCVTNADLESGLRALPARYRALFDRVRKVFEADERVRAMWVHGAMARGAADAGSDLDVDIAVADEHFDGFTAAWQEWLADITDTVSAVPIPGMAGSFYTLTPTCERLDVITESVSALPTSPLTRRLVVFDRDGLSALVPTPSDPPPDRGLLRYLIEEPLRQAANFPTVLIREDWLLGVVAVQQIHQYLYLIFAEANKPQPPTGPKQWSFKLTPAHRRLLESLPVPQPTRDSVLAARRAALRMLLTECPQVASEHAVEWPTALADAVRSFLEREGLGVEG